MDIDSRIKLVADEIRSYGAIAILGAGISLGQGVPLTSHLQMLLWNALDSDENALKVLAEKLGQDIISAKILIGDDPDKTNIALKILASNPVAIRTFQYSFKKLNNKKIKNPSISHNIISKLLHRRNIEMVISLNWDTLLETAYNRHYGSIIPSDWLKKPHGDAANPDLKWILPNEDSNLPDDMVKEISALAKEHPRILLIIGYSERDEEIVSKIINPLSDQWRVIRISPNTTDEYGIPLTAEEALLKLYEYIHNNNSEVPGCEYINFNNKHDLGAALSGIGLTPADVDVCTKLPEVNIAKKQLEIAGSSVIIGEMGCGKSLIAYQIAYALNKEGWEILRLNEINQPKEVLIDHLLNLPCKSLLIIDNAQTFEKDTISYILENASSDRIKILIITTDDDISRYDKIHVAGKNAVSIIAEDFKNREKEILPIIQKFDDSIGEGYFDTPLKQRINAAVLSSKTPWQFNFILTGGWHRADGVVTLLREKDRFDLLLAAISIKQIVSLDTGSTLDWLKKASEILGKDNSWMDNAIQEFKDRHLIIEGDTIRCPHVRFSEVIINIIYKNQNDDYHDQLINLFRMAINEEIPSLKGVFWAFNTRLSFETSHYLFKAIIDPETLEKLMNRCWTSSSNEDINYASRILSTLLDWFPDLIDDFKSNLKVIAKWIEEADAKSAHGLGRLLNHLGQKDHELTETIIGLVDPKIIVNNLNQINISDAYVWGSFLDRLAYTSSDEWREQLKNSLDSSFLYSLFFNIEAKIDDIQSIDELVQGISSFDHSLGISLVDLTIPQIASAFNNDIIKFYDINETIWFVLGFAPNFLRTGGPSQEQKQVATKLAEAINAESAAQIISKSHRREWKAHADFMHFLKEVMPEKAAQIAHLVDFNTLNDTSKDLWKNPSGELIDMIRALSVEDDGEPARSWINQHSDEFCSLNPLLVAIAPESAIKIIRDGYELELKSMNSDYWIYAAMVVYSLSKVDKEVASMVIKTNQKNIVKGFELRKHDCNYECFPKFIELMKELTPDTLKEYLESLDPTIIKTSWTERLNGDEEERKAAETLINLIINENIDSLVGVVQELKN